MIAGIDFLNTAEQNVPILPVYIANTKARIRYSKSVPQLIPPITNDTAISGILAITKVITLSTADVILPIIMLYGGVVVVSKTSIVCLSLSPDMDDAVKIGTISDMIQSCAIPITGKNETYPS